MPLTAKGNKILANMRSEYGDKKGTSVFYASRNKGTITGVEPGYASGGIVDHDQDPDLPPLQDDARLERVSPNYPPQYLETIEKLLQNQRRLQGLDRYIPGIDPPYMESYQRLHAKPAPPATTGQQRARGGEIEDPNFFYRRDREREAAPPRRRLHPRAQQIGFMDHVPDDGEHLPTSRLRRFRRGGEYQGNGIDEVWDGSQAGHRWAGGVKHLDDGGGDSGGGGTGGCSSGDAGGCGGCGGSGCAGCGCSGDSCGAGACGACSCGGSCGCSASACSGSACGGSGCGGGSSSAGGGGGNAGGVGEGVGGGFGAAGGCFGAAAASAGAEGETGEGQGGGGRGGGQAGFGGPAGAGTEGLGAEAAGGFFGVGQTGQTGAVAGTMDAALGAQTGGRGAVGDVGGGRGTGGAWGGYASGEFGYGGPGSYGPGGMFGSQGACQGPGAFAGGYYGTGGAGIASGALGANTGGFFGSGPGVGLGYGGTGAPGTGAFGAEGDAGGGGTSGIGNAGASFGAGFGGTSGYASSGTTVSNSVAAAAADAGDDDSGGGRGASGGAGRGGAASAGIGASPGEASNEAAGLGLAGTGFGTVGGNPSAASSLSGTGGEPSGGPSDVGGGIGEGPDSGGGSGANTAAAAADNAVAAAVDNATVAGAAPAAAVGSADQDADQDETTGQGKGGDKGVAPAAAAAPTGDKDAAAIDAAVSADRTSGFSQDPGGPFGTLGPSAYGVAADPQTGAVPGTVQSDLAMDPGPDARGALSGLVGVPDSRTGLFGGPTPSLGGAWGLGTPAAAAELDLSTPVSAPPSTSTGEFGPSYGGWTAETASPGGKAGTAGPQAGQGFGPGSMGFAGLDALAQASPDQNIGNLGNIGLGSIAGASPSLGIGGLGPGGWTGGLAGGQEEAPAAAGPPAAAPTGSIETDTPAEISAPPADLDPTMEPPAVPALPSRDFDPGRTGGRGLGAQYASLDPTMVAQEQVTPQENVYEVVPPANFNERFGGFDPLAAPTVAPNPGFGEPSWDFGAPPAPGPPGPSNLGPTMGGLPAAIGNALAGLGISPAAAATPEEGRSGQPSFGPQADPLSGAVQTEPTTPDPGFTPGSKGTVTTEPLADLPAVTVTPEEKSATPYGLGASRGWGGPTVTGTKDALSGGLQGLGTLAGDRPGGLVSAGPTGWVGSVQADQPTGDFAPGGGQFGGRGATGSWGDQQSDLGGPTVGGLIGAAQAAELAPGIGVTYDVAPGKGDRGTVATSQQAANDLNTASLDALAAQGGRAAGIEALSTAMGGGRGGTTDVAADQTTTSVSPSVAPAAPAVAPSSMGLDFSDLSTVATPGLAEQTGGKGDRSQSVDRGGKGDMGPFTGAALSPGIATPSLSAFDPMAYAPAATEAPAAPAASEAPAAPTGAVEAPAAPAASEAPAAAVAAAVADQPAEVSEDRSAVTPGLAAPAATESPNVATAERSAIAGLAPAPGKGDLDRTQGPGVASPSLDAFDPATYAPAASPQTVDRGAKGGFESVAPGAFPGGLATTGLEGFDSNVSFSPGYAPTNTTEYGPGVSPADRAAAIDKAVSDQNFTTGWEGMFGSYNPNAVVADEPVTDQPVVDRTAKTDRDTDRDLEQDRAAPVTPVTKEPLPNIAPPPPFGGRPGGLQALQDMIFGPPAQTVDRTNKGDQPKDTVQEAEKTTTTVPQNVPPPPEVTPPPPEVVDPRDRTQPSKTAQPAPPSERTGTPTPSVQTDQPSTQAPAAPAAPVGGLGATPGYTGLGAQVGNEWQQVAGQQIQHETRRQPDKVAGLMQIDPSIMARLQQDFTPEQLNQMFKDVGFSRGQGSGPTPDQSDQPNQVELVQSMPPFGSQMADGGLIAGLAAGGLTPSSMRSAATTAHYTGVNAKQAMGPGVHLINSSTVGGRTDRIPMRAKPGSFVLPADVVSGLGQGNTTVGAKMWGALISKAVGPLGTAVSGIPRGSMPKAPSMPRMGGSGTRGFASGGVDHTHQEWTPIVVAGGEALVDPEFVEALGNGSETLGKRLLSENVMLVRKQVIARMKKLPRPAA